MDTRGADGTAKVRATTMVAVACAAITVAMVALSRALPAGTATLVVTTVGATINALMVLLIPMQLRRERLWVHVSVVATVLSVVALLAIPMATVANSIATPEPIPAVEGR